MKVIENRQVVVDDWRLLNDTHTIPDGGDVIVSIARWNKERELLTRRAGKSGVVVGSGENPADIEALHSLPLVAIDFPKFTDGRGYSHARQLRERLGFKGELRAVGNVLRDQLFYMHRCGITSFALEASKDIEGAIAAFDEFDVTYQPAADESQPLFRRVSR